MGVSNHSIAQAFGVHDRESVPTKRNTLAAGCRFPIERGGRHTFLLTTSMCRYELHQQ